MTSIRSTFKEAEEEDEQQRIERTTNLQSTVGESGNDEDDFDTETGVGGRANDDDNNNNNNNNDRNDGGDDAEDGKEKNNVGTEEDDPEKENDDDDDDDITVILIEPTSRSVGGGLGAGGYLEWLGISLGGNSIPPVPAAAAEAEVNNTNRRRRPNYAAGAAATAAVEFSPEVQERRRAILLRELRRVQRASFVQFALLCTIPTVLLLIVVSTILQPPPECGFLGAAAAAGDSEGLTCMLEPRTFMNAFTTRCVCDSIPVEPSNEFP